MKFEEYYCFLCKKNFYVREDQSPEECPTCSGGDIEVSGDLLDAKELYFQLKHQATRKQLEKSAKVCGPGEIGEILSNKENQFVFQTEYKRFWEDTE